MSDFWDWTPEEVIEAWKEGDVTLASADEINETSKRILEIVYRTKEGKVVFHYEVQSKAWVHDEDGIQDEINIDQP